MTYSVFSEQLQEIRKITFARLICDNCDYIDTIQKFVMLQPIEKAFQHLGSVLMVLSRRHRTANADFHTV